MSFSNPMFNVEPPSNVYSEEPSRDITFGVDNPGYVGMTELTDLNVDNKDDHEDGGNHYEIIDMAENVDNMEDNDAAETMSNLNIEIMDIDLNFVKEETKALTNEIFVEHANELLETQTSTKNEDANDKENIFETVEDVIENEGMMIKTLIEDVNNITVSESDFDDKIDDSSNEKANTGEAGTDEDVALEASDNIIEQEIPETNADYKEEEFSKNLLDIWNVYFQSLIQSQYI